MNVIPYGITLRGRMTIRNNQIIYRPKPPAVATENPCTCKRCGKTFISVKYLADHDCRPVGE